MLVYRDPFYVCPANSVLSRIRDQLTTSTSVDDLRLLLIQAGELEQGAADYFESAHQSAPLDKIAILTDLIADLFFSVWSYGNKSASKNPLLNDGALVRISSLLGQIQFQNDLCFKIKIPEGFAFYSLFPEQYCLSAMQWSAEHSQAASRQVLVIGLRSIGTTLSAVAAASLRSSGWKTKRLTVRPAGPAFSRTMEMDAPAFVGINHAIIVDEGPGLSGSSMAAAAEWVAKAGISEIAFLPGHPGGPGTAASSDVQRWWSNTPIYFAPLKTLRWNGETLQELLLAKSKVHSSTIKYIQDVSAGKWRRWAFPQEKQWPAVCKTFERSKFLSGGKHPEILWKFNGLNSYSGKMTSGANNEFAQRNKLSKGGFTAAPLDTCRGFIAMSWINGKRLNKTDSKDPNILQHLGRYIAHAAEPGLDSREAHSAIDRLREMLYSNVKEALGEELAVRAIDSTSFATRWPTPFSYGDGHLAPHEWVRTKAGKILKTDHTGHSSDHTLIGKQSVLWDLAGAIIEWDLNESQIEVLMNELQARKARINSRSLEFYLLAYAAFRMGFTRLGSTQEGEDKVERNRLVRASKRYQKKLVALLNQPSS